MNAFSGLSYDARSRLFDSMLQQSVGKNYPERIKIVQDYVEAGRYAGKPRLERMFKNFGDGYRVNLDDPGVIKNIRRLGVDGRKGLWDKMQMTGSASLGARNQVQGASRELAYYQKLYNSPRSFTSVRMGAPVKTMRGGVSDMDVTFSSRATGRRVWLEVKSNRKLELDARTLAQLDRMAKFKGQRLVASSGRVAAGYMAAAEARGVTVMDNVKSGELVSRLERELGGQRAAAGRAGMRQAVSGAATRNSFAGGNRIAARPATARLRVGSAAARNGGVAIRSVAPGAGAAARNGAGVVVARLAGAAGAVITVGNGAYVTWKVHRGDLDPRTGTRKLSGIAGSVGGGTVGYAGGSVLGGICGFAIAGPPGAATGVVVGKVVGSVVGGAAGYYAGDQVGNFCYDKFRFSNKEFARQQAEIRRRSLEY